ncbi:MAG: hypothetical protein A4E30_00273 [Methanomassiliicoccales archaeon PtaB.Bin215]|nr:MAG: hypothetical protein A4E30_00273 [Methanomassiliicoccales archaeon PtaB.Bin215]
MADDPELQHFSNAEHLNSKHDTLLQTLNRRVGPKKTFYDARCFAQTVDAWATVPVIYAKDHPDMSAYDSDPAVELARINGRIVGKVENPKLSTTGHPRLLGDTRFNDASMDAKIAAGELSLSTGFRAPVREGALAGPVRPHHVLVFEETESDQPWDQGAGFLNKETKDMGDEQKDEKKQAKGLFGFLRKKIKEEYPDIDLDRTGADDHAAGDKPEESKDKEQEDMNANDQAGKAEIERLQAELNKREEAIKARDAELQDLKNKADALEKERMEAAWNEFKNKAWVPKGYLHKDKETETRQRFENDRAALFEELLNKKDAAPGGEDGAEQVAHQNKQAATTVGRWDAKKGEYVEE